MAFDVNKPADDQTIALGPADIRENFRALKDDKIVNALKVNDYSPGNANGNIAVNNGSVNTNLNADKVDGHDAGNAANNVMVLDGNALTPLANIPSELTGKNAATATTAANATNHINNASGAHAGSAISITATSYGRGLATTDNTVQKIADRVNQNGTPAFKTSKDKCSLMLNFKDGLADSTNGIVPVGYNTATKRGTDNFISNPDGSISATLKQFEGDEGKFGSGVAVEESRTNYYPNSQNIAANGFSGSAPYATNITTPLGILGISLEKTQLTRGNFSLAITSGYYYTISFWAKVKDHNQSGGFKIYMFDSSYSNVLEFTIPTADIAYNKWKRYKVTAVASGTSIASVCFCLNIANGGWAWTGDIDGFQFESSDFGTSYIATGATAVTRPAGKLNYDKPDMLNSSNYSLSFWVKHNFAYNETVSFANGLFSFGSSPTHTIYYDARFNIYQIGFGSGLNSIDVIATNFNDWKHFIVTQNGTIGKVYINNVKILEVSNATPIDFSSLTLGKYGAFPANSNISNFAIFNYALSADEISQIYNSGLEGKPVEVANAPDVVAVDRLTKAINATYADHATTATNATNATNADTLDSYHAAAFALVGHTTHTGEAASLATSGYKKFADGTIIQWGQDSWLSSESSKLIFFPVAFPLEPKSILVLPYTTSMTYTPTKIAAAHGSNYFTAYRDTTDAPINFYWIAIGY